MRLRRAQRAGDAQSLQLHALTEKASGLILRRAGERPQRCGGGALRLDRQQLALQARRAYGRAVRRDRFELGPNAAQLAKCSCCPCEMSVWTLRSAGHLGSARGTPEGVTVPACCACERLAGSTIPCLGRLLVHGHNCAASLAENGRALARQPRFPLRKVNPRPEVLGGQARAAAGKEVSQRPNRKARHWPRSDASRRRFQPTASRDPPARHSIMTLSTYSSPSAVGGAKMHRRASAGEASAQPLGSGTTRTSPAASPGLSETSTTSASRSRRNPTRCQLAASSRQGDTAAPPGWMTALRLGAISRPNEVLLRSNLTAVPGQGRAKRSTVTNRVSPSRIGQQNDACTPSLSTLT